MKTATKIGLLALGSAAAMVAIVAMTLHEEDNQERLSQALEDLSDLMQKEKKRLTEKVERLDLPNFFE